MERRRLLAAGTGALAVATASRLGLEDPGPSRLYLTVRNDGDAAVDVEVVVEGDGGTTYAEESDRVDAGVAPAFEVAVGARGRHEVGDECLDPR
jgi:hypothetical protein